MPPEQTHEGTQAFAMPSGPDGSSQAAAARQEAEEPDELLTPGQVARLFGVDPKTVTRWASAGKLTALHTLGGHRRYRSTEVHDLLDRANRPG